MADRILTIKELTREIKRWLEEHPGLRDVWVRGEISNFTHHSRGHMYFTLKDETSRIRAVMFLSHNQFLKFKPKDGLKVLARGEVNVFERDGQYQFYVKEMQPDGIGSLYQAFEELKEKLSKRGWFSPERKKPIPLYPRVVGVITSPTGAAIRDIITTIKRRYPIVEIKVFPVLVQGSEAAASIARAIRLAQELDIDVLIVGRGGGSIEELWAFNEEIVAEAIVSSRIPIISAVGHETDVTIADFVADLRAATPTAAAEQAVPVLAELKERLSLRKKQLIQSIQRLVRDRRKELARWQQSYAFKYPKQLLVQKEQELDDLIQSLTKSMRAYIDERKKQLYFKNAHLDALSPLKIMSKGYSLVYDQGKTRLYHSVKQIAPGQAVQIVMQDGELDCHVWGIKEEKPYD